MNILFSATGPASSVPPPARESMNDIDQSGEHLHDQTLGSTRPDGVSSTGIGVEISALPSGGLVSSELNGTMIFKDRNGKGYMHPPPSVSPLLKVE